jgi:hypothetical protein
MSKGKPRRAYVAVFNCLQTRNVNLELVSSLTKDAFLAALNRHIAVRGKPEIMLSDNATNFRGAQEEMAKLYGKPNGRDVEEYAAQQGFKWIFTPPRSPHCGGVFESMVKLTKHHLLRVTRNKVFNFEQFQTLIKQISACINSRPLMESEDPSQEYISPAHFLIGRPMVCLRDPPPTEGRINASAELDEAKNRPKLWKELQRSALSFWKKWSEDYRRDLQQRSKWCQQKRNFKVGDVVLLADGEYRRMTWPIGRILEVYPDTDGFVRTAKCRMSGFQAPIVRSIHKLAFLEDSVIEQEAQKVRKTARDAPRPQRLLD